MKRNSVLQLQGETSSQWKYCSSKGEIFPLWKYYRFEGKGNLAFKSKSYKVTLHNKPHTSFFWGVGRDTRGCLGLGEKHQRTEAF